MNLRYMIDMVLRESASGAPVYDPVGVWVQGSGPGLDIVMEYLQSDDPEVADAREEADWVLNRLVENDIKELTEDFLEYHRQTLSPYCGSRSEVVATDEYAFGESCAKAILEKISRSSPTG